MGVGFFNYNKGKKLEKVVKGVKSIFSKTDDTITGMKPTTGQKETRNFKIGVASKKVNNNMTKLATQKTERNKRSKELFKNK